MRFLSKGNGRLVSLGDVYDFWETAPFGMKRGVMPVLAVAFIQAMRDKLAIHRENVFRARFDEIDVEFLIRDPADIQLRWVEGFAKNKDMVASLNALLLSFGHGDPEGEPEVLGVAKGLVAVYVGLPAWVHRTSHLSDVAKRIRDTLKSASDPNQLLFEDLPMACHSTDGGKPGKGNAGKGKAGNGKSKDGRSFVEVVSEGLGELVQAYETMLGKFSDRMLDELQVRDRSGKAFEELRARAENIKDIHGDFRLSAFITRLTEFEWRTQDIEGIASLAANKPPRDWVDNDIDHATVEVASFAEKFIRLESFARVKGRPDKRQSIAVIVGLKGRQEPVHAEFEVSDAEKEDIAEVVAQLEEVVNAEEDKGARVVLAAIAEFSSRYASKLNGDDTPDGQEPSNGAHQGQVSAASRRATIRRVV